MKAALVPTVVLVLASLAACEPPRYGVAGEPLQPADATSLMQRAHAEKSSGLVDADARARYFSLLAEACEIANSEEACAEAERFDPVRGRPLVAHGCAMGSEEACNALLISEMNHERKTQDQAYDDVMRIFELGCTQGITPECLKRASKTELKALTAQRNFDNESKREQEQAFDACVSVCRDRRRACTSQCDFDTWQKCAIVEGCASEERACATLCGVDAVAMCNGPLDSACHLSADVWGEDYLAMLTMPDDPAPADK
jgi:hypothetical protein